MKLSNRFSICFCVYYNSIIPERILLKFSSSVFAWTEIQPLIPVFLLLMSLKDIIRNLRQLGIKPSHQIWEAFLIRKINFISAVAFFNVTIAWLVFPLFGITEFQTLLLVCAVLAPLVFFVNVRFGYVAGAYGFFLVGLGMVLTMAIRLGSDSYSPLFLFPITLSIVQLLGRRETFVHMIVILILYMVGILFMTWSYRNGYYAIGLSGDTLRAVQMFNIIFSSFTGITFIIQITIENNRQEKMIRDMLKEKDVLVAEVFHRVKNNMNIVTSLLNLKQHNSGSPEVRDALQDCRNRVFSMALVHEKIFQTNAVSRLDFGEYAHDLADEISESLALSGDDLISVSADEMELPLNFAIPCGLILNELVTNSCKHARVKGQPLKIQISIRTENGKRSVHVQDNGPGATEQELDKPGSLGVDLIRSLCQQIDAEYRFEQKNGMHFYMQF